MAPEVTGTKSAMGPHPGRRVADWIDIAGRRIGPGHPVFIIAEAGVNHNGHMDLAHRLIDAARAARADAVKFQLFDPEELVAAGAGKAPYQRETTGAAGSQLDMLRALALTPAQHAELKQHCEAAGILYLVTPYEEKSLSALDALGVAAYKIGSTDTTNLPFLRQVVRKNKPVILATGMCTLGEVEAAWQVFSNANPPVPLALLHCTTEYPAAPAEANLRAIWTMARAFSCPVGFSDHTAGVGASPWAVAAGACIIEKHFTLDCGLPGPDHGASLDPAGLARLVQSVREVELALGDGHKRPMPSELANRAHVRKSLVCRAALRAGAVLRPEHVACKRPGTGLDPAWFERVVGRRTTRDLAPDTLLTLADIDWATPQPARGASAPGREDDKVS